MRSGCDKWNRIGAICSTGVHALESKNVALIVGCTIGGVIFLILVLILVILVCKRPSDKPKSRNPANDYYPTSANGRPASYPESAPVPPGIWTTNPSMYATRPTSLPPGHYANGYAGRHSDQTKHNSGVPLLNPKSKSLVTVNGVEATMKIDDDLITNVHSRTITGELVSNGGEETARAYGNHCAPLDNRMSPFVAKVYSDYQLPRDYLHGAGDTTTARAFSGYPLSPEYSTPHDAFRFTQSDAALNRTSAVGLMRANSSVEPRLGGGGGGGGGVGGHYGHGIHMQRSDAHEYADRRPINRTRQANPVPSQLLMYRHLQEEHARQKSGGVTRSSGEVSQISHYSPDSDPNALYAQPSKVKRDAAKPGRIAEEDGSEAGQQVMVEAVIEEREKNAHEEHRPRSRARHDTAEIDGMHPGEVTADAFKFLEDFEDNMSFAEESLGRPGR